MARPKGEENQMETCQYKWLIQNDLMMRCNVLKQVLQSAQLLISSWNIRARGLREVTPYMILETFTRVLDVLRNEDPVYGNASTGFVTVQDEEIGEDGS